jgi:hypothetical protein
LNQILKEKIKRKKKDSNKIYINKKFKDQIWYNQQIIWYF